MRMWCRAVGAVLLLVFTLSSCQESPYLDDIVAELTAAAQAGPIQGPTREPILLEGSGDSVVDVDLGGSPIVARIRNSGGGNFLLLAYGAGDERIRTLVEAPGSYDGVVGIDFLEGEETVSFEVISNGRWSVEELSPEQVRWVTVPEFIEGRGDEVMLLERGKKARSLTLIPSGKGGFHIRLFGDNHRVQLVDVRSGSDPALIFPIRGLYMLQVRAEGAWAVRLND